MLAQSKPPAFEVGEHCFRPYDCPYYDHRSQGLVKAEQPISDLYRLSPRRRKELIANGVETIPDIPDDFPLSNVQERIRDAVRSGQPRRPAERYDQLNNVEWPL